jgi:hypothetical protein
MKLDGVGISLLDICYEGAIWYDLVRWNGHLVRFGTMVRTFGTIWYDKAERKNLDQRIRFLMATMKLTRPELHEK